MNKLSMMALLAALAGTSAVPASAANLTEAELLQAATELGHQYDTHYAAKDPDGMTSVYAADGELISPAGPIVRGRAALKQYYIKRFASGANGHAIKVLEVHVQGDGGYGINQFSVNVPGPGGTFHEEHGIIVAAYRHDPDGWHMALVGTSVPPKAD
jgi:ketosteroid isomerase-like protein